MEDYSVPFALPLSVRRADAVEKVLRPLLPATITFGRGEQPYPNDNPARRGRVQLHYVAG